MSALEKLIAKLFRMPGGCDTGTNSFLRDAARAHRGLLARAAGEAGMTKAPAGSLLEGIDSLVGRIPDRAMRDRFLLDPTFIEALHAAAGESPSLAEWHHQIADPSVAGVWSRASFQSASHLGNSLLALLLRDDPHWEGEVVLQTDLYGWLRFPLCDWSMALWSKADGRDAVLSQQPITAHVTRREVRLSLAAQPNDALLVMGRKEWLRMLIGGAERLECREITWPSGDIGLRFQYASPIPGWNVRYDPVVMGQCDRHAELTGGLVATALAAISQHSPGVASAFNATMSAVRGWELSPATYGTLQSFSDPTLPRVMGINVVYSADDQPQLCPFCFTWFGHELGHTTSYLIETLLHVHGHTLTTSHGQFTEPIPRYGRIMPVRTLLQIPYTHLYEWVLMIDFLEGNFSGLPWRIDEDPFAFAEDVRAEIEEAFDRIARDVTLSAAGELVMARLHELYAAVLERWRGVGARPGKLQIANQPSQI